jgi:cell wall-associated NlpC family hydrolase
MLAEPTLDARQVSQVRYGEFLDVFEKRKDGFAWVQNRADRYVGYIPMDGVLSEEIADLSSRVYTLQTFVYPEADIKSPPIDELTMGSHVSLVGQKGKLAQLASGGYVFAKHIVPAKDVETKDYVFTAGRMINTPYLWGGRTPKGLDCSGLVQLALEMAGIDAPRDSDQQREVFAQPLSIHWHDVAWRRGDIVFFPGHVGIMTNGADIIHASADEMRVVVEPLYDVVMRGNDLIAAGRP